MLAFLNLPSSFPNFKIYVLVLFPNIAINDLYFFYIKVTNKGWERSSMGKAHMHAGGPQHLKQ